MKDSHQETEKPIQPSDVLSQNEIDILSESMSTALTLLLQAHRFAIEVSRDQWDFALEISNLRRAGLNESHFRWLVCKGFVKHASEVTLFGQKGRCFRPTGELNFTGTTCMILTPAGIEFADNSLTEKMYAADRRNGKPESIESEISQNGDERLPNWDPWRHELRLGNQLIKQFKHRSPNQEIILAAFQEEGWPVSVRDPLHPLQEVDSKRRLNDTIKSLNHHHHVQELIRFRGDGTGEGIIWEHVRRSDRVNGNSRRDCTSATGTVVADGG